MKQKNLKRISIGMERLGIKHLLTERLYFGYYQFLFIPFLEIKKELV